LEHLHIYSSDLYNFIKALKPIFEIIIILGLAYSFGALIALFTRDIDVDDDLG